MTQDSAPAVLRSHGLRITAPRTAVLGELAEHPHATVEALVRGSRERLGSVSTQTVYDVLAAFSRTGLVRRFEPAGHPARYELDLGDNHHHLVCRSCGAMSDVPCAIGAAACLTAAVDHGYVIDEAEVIYWGTCPACTRAEHDASAPTTPPDPAHPHEGAHG